jgi:hypothetical protein
MPSVSDKTTGHREVNLRVMLGTVFANMSYDGYVRQEIINKRAFQSSKTFTNMRRIVFDAIEAIATRMMTEQLEACIKHGGCVFDHLSTLVIFPPWPS